jgi:hypothetical protein
MATLEQMIENSFFDKLKIGLSRIKYSVIGKATVYSLAGVLSAGLGYGCEGNECGNGDCESTYEDCNSCPDDCGNCLPEQSNNDRSNPGSNNGTNDNSGSNSGTGGYCDPCDSDLDCKSGWRCYEYAPFFYQRDINFQTTFCMPSIKCTSDSQCEGYRCNVVSECRPEVYDIGCDVNHNIWFKNNCGDGIGIIECDGNDQCLNLKECGGNIICSDAEIFWHNRDNGDKYACGKVTIKDD